MRSTTWCVVALATVLIGGGCGSRSNPISVLEPAGVKDLIAASSTTPTAPVRRDVTPPMDRALERVTKKPFGIYITTASSTVSPERFHGYHTGVDFEIFDGEKDTDVPIRTICAGPLLEKEWTAGYGGVAVQKCVLAGQTVTIIYGHIKLASVSRKVGQEIPQGEQLAILGKGYSTETDRERKHLHLGIHKTGVINIVGYVQNKASLSAWLDVRTFLTP